MSLPLVPCSLESRAVELVSLSKLGIVNRYDRLIKNVHFLVFSVFEIHASEVIGTNLKRTGFYSNTCKITKHD
jgi:hypothetical protein